MSELVNEFNTYRSKMNDVILGKQNKVINRLFNLDTNTYAEGALSVKTKEMLGLVASMVLRCDDCIKYHLGKCHELGVTTEEVYEIFAVANIVAVSYTHLRAHETVLDIVCRLLHEKQKTQKKKSRIH